MLLLTFVAMPGQVQFDVSTTEAAEWRLRVLGAGRHYRHFCILENRATGPLHSWLGPEEWQAGLGSVQSLGGESGFFDRLAQCSHNLPLMGFLGYDLKNQIEKLSSDNPDHVCAPEAFLFEPIHFIAYRNGKLSIHSHQNAEAMRRALEQEALPRISPLPSISLIPRIEKEAYLEKVRTVQRNIYLGEVYELNLCVEHYATGVDLDPLNAYLALCDRAQAPFSAWLSLDGLHCLCASPERFLKKEGNRLLSQPIKGTRPRSDDPGTDRRLRQELAESEKDRAENVMIVDLVRNDLTRSCRYGSIRVEELFGIYSFAQVHQMISTVSGELREDQHFARAIASAFPMGSMTGAPKVRAMQLIEELEESKRGIFSGSIGIIHPHGDFDLNVVIRSILYNEQDGYLSVQAGGAITCDSEPEDEWEEIRVKLKAIHSLFHA